MLTALILLGLTQLLVLASTCTSISSEKALTLIVPSLFGAIAALMAAEIADTVGTVPDIHSFSFNPWESQVAAVTAYITIYGLTYLLYRGVITR